MQRFPMVAKIGDGKLTEAMPAQSEKTVCTMNFIFGVNSRARTFKLNREVFRKIVYATEPCSRS